jgi:K+-sensing histidine kinase KdpD
MATDRTGGLNQNDSDLGSAAMVAMVFLLSLIASAAALVTHTTHQRSIWLPFFLILVALTSRKQRWWWALYTGLVAGLFFNFFFEAPKGELSFDSTGEIWIQIAFFGVALLSHWARRWVRRFADRRPPKTRPSKDEDEFVWNSRTPDMDKSGSAFKESVWISG